MYGYVQVPDQIGTIMNCIEFRVFDMREIPILFEGLVNLDSRFVVQEAVLGGSRWISPRSHLFHHLL